jgi:cytochrome oxidase Cu insertion factor (SCO1/SenC/PrrC family)
VGGAEVKLDGRKTLLLIVAVCVLPIAASYLTFYVIRPGGTAQHGELLPTAPLPALSLATAQGQPTSLEQFRGKWVMLHLDRGACDARCRSKLYFMRQVRTAQGKDMGRVERVWLLTDGTWPAEESMKDYPGMHVLRLASTDAAAVFPAQGDAAAHIYVIDPLGNLMMRYPDNPDPRRMIKDLSRLLKTSRIG